MFMHLGRFAASRPRTVCAAWIGLGCLLALVAPSWNGSTQDDDIRFLPERCPSVRGYQLMEKAFPDDVFASRLVLAVERTDRQLTAKDFDLVAQIVEDLEKLRKEAPELK